jgi:peptide/nickel transport system permease protein
MLWTMFGAVTRRSGLAWTLALALVLVVAGVALLGPLVAGDPFALDIDGGLSALGAPLPPSASAPLGTDPLGRDVWARIAHAAGISLWISLVATIIASVVGVIVGLVAGYAGGKVDNALMRFVDLALAFPFLLLAILLAALLRESSLASSYLPVVIPLATVGWTTTARLVRARALVIARSEYAIAARSLGASAARIIVRHVMPNLAGVIAVTCAFTFAQNLLGEAVLSFLGLGPPPPTPTWGRMLYEGRAYYRSAPWLVIAPGVAIVVAVAAFNMLGETLRGSRAATEDR